MSKSADGIKALTDITKLNKKSRNDYQRPTTLLNAFNKIVY
jgi:hypothetical protein